jgi:hypothetical protein
MDFLRGRALFEFQKRVDHLPAIVEDGSQFLSASISDPNDVP